MTSTTILAQPTQLGANGQHASPQSATTSATGGMSLEQSHLCLVCKSIFDGLTPRNEFGEVTHYGLEALFTSASRGCHLCLTVSQTIDPEQFRSFRMRIEKGEHVESWGFAAISPIARDQARIRFRYLRTKRTNEELFEGMTTSEKRKTRMTMILSPNQSVDFSDASGSSDGGRIHKEKMPILVELILMNPKCRYQHVLIVFVSLTNDFHQMLSSLASEKSVWTRYIRDPMRVSTLPGNGSMSACSTI
jgi:hypothetical protein